MQIFGYEIKKASDMNMPVVPSELISPSAHLNPGRWYYDLLIKEGIPNPAVLGCITAWTTTLHEAVLRVRDPKTQTYIKDHPIEKLFSKIDGSLNIFYIAVGGNSYLYKLRNRFGEIASLALYSSRHIKPVPSQYASTPISHYHYNFNNIRYDIPVDDIIHLKSHIADPNNPILGYSPIQAAGTSIDIANSLDNIIYSTIVNHAMPTSIVTPKEPVSDKSADILKTSWLERFSVKLRGKQRETTGFFATPVDVQRLAMNFEEMQNKELWGKYEMGVCGAFRVPTSLAMVYASLENGTMNNVLTEYKTFTTLFRVPMWKKWSIEIAAGLTKEFPDALIEYDTSNVEALQIPPEEKEKSATALYEKGIISRNEAREAAGYDRIDGGDIFAQPSITVQPVKSIRNKSIESIMTEEKAIDLFNTYKSFVDDYGEGISKAFSKEAEKLEKEVLSSVKSGIDWDEWEKKFEKATEKERRKMVEAAILTAWDMAEVGEEIGSDYDKIFKRALKESASKISDSIGTIKNELKDLIADNQEATAEELAKIIKQRFETIKDSRANAIGRTTTTSTNGSVQKSVQKTANDRIQDPKKKIVRVWLSARISTTRDGHAALDGVIESDEGTWSLNGVSIEHPAASGLPAKDAVNCLCTTVFVKAGKLK